MDNKFKEMTTEIVIEFLKNMKKEIEADGLIPTIDEAIIRLEGKE